MPFPAPIWHGPLGWTPRWIRKDIEMIGNCGKTAGQGHPERALVTWLENFLGLCRPKAAVLAGTGSLGSALARLSEIPQPWDGNRGGIRPDLMPIRSGRGFMAWKYNRCFAWRDFIRRTGVPLGLIATPAGAAQSVADPDG